MFDKIYRLKNAIQSVWKWLGDNNKPIATTVLLITTPLALYKFHTLIFDNNIKNSPKTKIISGNNNAHKLKSAQINSKAENVNKLLTQADKCLKNNQLTIPIDNNALIFFRKVLILDPQNKEAKTGIKKIERRYIQIISTAKENNDLSLASLYTDRLLKINTKNNYYKELKLALLSQIKNGEKVPKKNTPEKQIKTDKDSLKIKQEEKNNLKVAQANLDENSITGHWIFLEPRSICGPLGCMDLKSKQYSFTISAGNHITIQKNWIKGVDECPFTLKVNFLTAKCNNGKRVNLTLIKKFRKIEVLYKNKSMVFSRATTKAEKDFIWFR